MALLQRFFWRLMKDRGIFFYDHFNHSIAKIWKVLERAILYSKTGIVTLFQIEIRAIFYSKTGIVTLFQIELFWDLITTIRSVRL